MQERTALIIRQTPRAAWLGIFLVWLLPGCAAEVVDDATSESVAALPHLPEAVAAWRRTRGLDKAKPLTAKERVQVLEILQARGLEISHAIFFAENTVLIEGDMLFDGPTVLRESSSERKKGYWFGPADPSEGYNILGAGRVNLNWNSPGPPDWDWVFAPFASVNDWLAGTHIDFAYSAEPGAMSTITIIPFEYPPWEGKMAWTWLGGHDIYDPSPIFFNLTWRGAAACNAWSISQLAPHIKRLIMTHEMAHAIGFAHVGQYNWIPGTAQGSGYPSVMYGDPCSNPTTTPSDDDYDSMNLMYYMPPL